MVKYYVTGEDAYGVWSRSNIYSKPFATKKEAQKYLRIAKRKYAYPTDRYTKIKISKNFKWKPSRG